MKTSRKRLRISATSLNSLGIVCLVVGLLAGPLGDSVSGAVPGGQGKKGGGGNKVKKPVGGGGNKGNKIKRDKKPGGGGQGKKSETKKKEQPKPAQPKSGEDKERKGEKPEKGNGGGRGGQKSRSKPVKISVREIGSLASTAMAWIQGRSGNASPSVAPFFGTGNLKSGGDKTTKQNNDSGVDTLAVLNDQQREKLRAILDRQRPLMQQFQAKQGELMSMLNGFRNDEPTSLSKVMLIARELGKLEVNIGMMQAELLAQMQIGLDGPELQRMQNIRSAYVNNYPASVTAEERDAAQSYLSSLPRDDQREMAGLASKALAWLTVARQPVDPESGEKKGGKNGGGKGSKSASYLAVKSGGGGNKEEAGYGILSQLTTSQVRILTSAAVSQAAYRSAYEERRGWLEQTLLAMKKARLTADMKTIERVASDLGGYSGRIAYSQAKAFQSLSKTLTDEQRTTLLTGRQISKRK